jgi:hypothetical protein
MWNRRALLPTSPGCSAPQGAQAEKLDGPLMRRALAFRPSRPAARSSSRRGRPSHRARQPGIRLGLQGHRSGGRDAAARPVRGRRDPAQPRVGRCQRLGFGGNDVDFIQIGGGIVTLLLALYVIDAIRRPDRGSPPVNRYDAEHPHPFARRCGRRAPPAPRARPRRNQGRDRHGRMRRSAPLLCQNGSQRAFRLVFGGHRASRGNSRRGRVGMPAATSRCRNAGAAVDLDATPGPGPGFAESGVAHARIRNGVARTRLFRRHDRVRGAVRSGVGET